MCEHGWKDHDWDEEYEENPNCLICKVCKMCYCQAHEIDLESQLTAANARVAELEKENARQKRLATISRLCKNVQACRAEQAEAKLEVQTETALQERARREQAEAQCAAMQSVLTAAREYDTICTQIHAMTEPIPGYMLDVARKARQALHDALELMPKRVPLDEAGAAQ